MGTPNDEIWPGVSELPDFKPSFPQWGPQRLDKIIPMLDSDGIDILNVGALLFLFASLTIFQQCLTYDQARRISAKRMRNHRWFDEYRAKLSESV